MNFERLIFFRMTMRRSVKISLFLYLRFIFLVTYLYSHIYRLIKVGETPGPISSTTRKVYQKYLTKLEKNNYKPFKVKVSVVEQTGHLV